MFGIQWGPEQRLTDLDFADDIALLAENDLTLQAMTDNLINCAAPFGLVISGQKSKIMRVGTNTQPQSIKAQGSTLDEVEQFTYLGSCIAQDGNVEEDINARLGKAAAVFRRMNNIWSSKTLNLDIKIRLYTTIVMSTAIYASETWKMTAKHTAKLDAFHQRCLRRILKVIRKDHVTNEEILKRTGQRRLRDIITERRLKFAGHMLRTSCTRPARTAITWRPADGKRKRGRPRRTWRDTVRDDLRARGETWEDAPLLAADRKRWLYIVARCPTGIGGAKV